MVSKWVWSMRPSSSNALACRRRSTADGMETATAPATAAAAPAEAAGAASAATAAARPHPSTRLFFGPGSSSDCIALTIPAMRPLPRLCTSFSPRPFSLSTTNKLYRTPRWSRVTPWTTSRGCAVSVPAGRGGTDSPALSIKQRRPPSYSVSSLSASCTVKVAYGPSQWKAMHPSTGPSVRRSAILASPGCNAISRAYCVPESSPKRAPNAASSSSVTLMSVLSGDKDVCAASRNWMHSCRSAADSSISLGASTRKVLSVATALPPCILAPANAAEEGVGAAARPASVSINHLVSGLLRSVDVKLLIIPRSRKMR
mmetsp:Transcript_50061/g.107285  ORF Transcript_50061/g.107285 Transcript_50061/m.107285 type:complete len:315 (-) Transcript_50061:121-1065(-)